MLIEIKDRVLTSVEVFLKFDDLSTKRVVLSVGNFERITYVNGSYLAVAEGRISNICVDPSNGENIIEMDLSGKYSSEKVYFAVNQIRDIYVEPVENNGMSFNFLIPESDKLGYSNIDYRGIENNAYIYFNENEFIDPNIVNMLLDKDAELGENNGCIYLGFNIDIARHSRYAKATHYAINYVTDILSEDVMPLPPHEKPIIGMGEDIIEIPPNKIINVPFYGYKVWYRISEDDEWIDGSELSIEGIAGDDKSLRQQLSYVLGVAPDRLAREYGYLFKFEPADIGRIDRYRIDLMIGNSMLGVQILNINYMSEHEEDALNESEE